jgi:hypothetical protein
MHLRNDSSPRRRWGPVDWALCVIVVGALLLLGLHNVLILARGYGL